LEQDWYYIAAFLYEAAKLLGVLWFFKKPQAGWKNKETNSMSSDASYKNPDKQSCNCQFRNHYLTLANIGLS
jgi:hypothetical protein